jgi:EAL domain-containing protein (putative c-di-GMP-specific phosphodiesterase class I)
VGFALDDFGTGYSSLTYLRRLPVKTLKIDQSFVREILNDPSNLLIVQAVIGLASAFQLHVIAEGVESVAHGRMLLQLECDHAQGYGISRPMPAAAVVDWVRTWRPDPSWAS